MKQHTTGFRKNNIEIYNIRMTLGAYRVLIIYKFTYNFYKFEDNTIKL